MDARLRRLEREVEVGREFLREAAAGQRRRKRREIEIPTVIANRQVEEVVQPVDFTAGQSFGESPFNKRYGDSSTVMGPRRVWAYTEQGVPSSED